MSCRYSWEDTSREDSNCFDFINSVFTSQTAKDKYDLTTEDIPNYDSQPKYSDDLEEDASRQFLTFLFTSQIEKDKNDLTNKDVFSSDTKLGQNFCQDCSYECSDIHTNKSSNNQTKTKKKKGRPTKDDIAKRPKNNKTSDARTDNASLKLKRHLLNFCIYFTNLLIASFFKKNNLGKPCRFYKICSDFKTSKKIEDLKDLKIYEILINKHDKKSLVDEDENFKNYEYLNKFDEFKDIFEQKLTDFLQKYYIRISEESSNIKRKRIFFKDLLNKNEEKGENYKNLLISILNKELDVNYQMTSI